MKPHLIAMFALCSLLLSACGSSQPPSTTILDLTGDPAVGRTLVQQPLLGEAPAPGCRNCHALEEGVVLVGPSFLTMSTLSEAELLQSIIDPNARLADGFEQGGMYTEYESDLTPQQIADIIAFIQSLDS